MEIYGHDVCIDLVATGHLTLDHARGTPMWVTQGTVWITQEQSYDDVILHAGDHWRVERQGRTIIEAQSDARLVLSEPVPAWRLHAGRLKKHWGDRAAELRRRAIRGWTCLRPQRTLPHY